MNTQVLKYSEYKISQALYLQIENNKRTNLGTNSEQYFLSRYTEYLNICGAEQKKIKYIRFLSKKINAYNMSFSEPNHKYKEWIAYKIDWIVDRLI